MKTADVTDRLIEVISTLSDGLEAYVEEHYSGGIKDHPAMAWRYARDMEPVVRARELLAELRPANKERNGDADT